MTFRPAVPGPVEWCSIGIWRVGQPGWRSRWGGRVPTTASTWSEISGQVILSSTGCARGRVPVCRRGPRRRGGSGSRGSRPSRRTAGTLEPPVEALAEFGGDLGTGGAEVAGAEDVQVVAGVDLQHLAAPAETGADVHPDVLDGAPGDAPVAGEPVDDGETLGVGAEPYRDDQVAQAHGADQHGGGDGEQRSARVALQIPVDAEARTGESP